MFIRIWDFEDKKFQEFETLYLKIIDVIEPYNMIILWLLLLYVSQ